MKYSDNSIIPYTQRRIAAKKMVQIRRLISHLDYSTQLLALAGGLATVIQDADKISPAMKFVDEIVQILLVSAAEDRGG